MTPETLSPTDEGAIRYGIADSSWSLVSAPTLSISEIGKNLMMPTILKFTNGWMLITYLRMDTTSGYTDVVRQLYDGYTPQGSPETLVSGTGTVEYARPHVTRVGNYLITCWDQNDSSGGGYSCYMRIDEISET